MRHRQATCCRLALRPAPGAEWEALQALEKEMDVGAAAVRLPAPGTPRVRPLPLSA